MAPQETNPRSGRPDEPPVSMVARIALIMRAFEEPGARYRLDQVAERTGLPRSTVHRILDQLLATGWLQRRADGYSLAAAAMTAGHTLGERPELRSVAAPVLNRLHLDTGLVVHLGVLVGAEVLYLDKIGARLTANLPTRVGGRSPAHATAIGKAMLAQVSAEDIDALYSHGMEKRTPRTISDIGTLHQELRRIRARRGLAFDNEELVAGLTSVGAAVFASDGLAGGLSMGGAVPLDKLQRLGPLMLRAAGHVTHRLAGAATLTREAGAPLSTTDGVLAKLMRTMPADAWV